MADMTNKHWPVRRIRNGDSLIVSDDRRTVSKVGWDEEQQSYYCEPLILDVDPIDGMTLVERTEGGRVKRLAPADADEWMLSAEWDVGQREYFGSYSSAVNRAQRRTHVSELEAEE